MPLTATVNMIAKCLRTDCSILGDNKKICCWMYYVSYPIILMRYME